MELDFTGVKAFAFLPFFNAAIGQLLKDIDFARIAAAQD